MTREHKRLRDAAQSVQEDQPGEPKPEQPLTRAEQEKQDRRVRRVERYDTVHALKAQGHSISAIARTTGLAPNTVRTLFHAETFPERAIRRPGPASLLPYESYLRERWAAGCRTATQLYQELCEKGYRGSYPTVSRFLASWRLNDPPLPVEISGLQPLTPRQAAWLFMQDPPELTADEKEALRHLQADEELAGLYDLAQTFCRLIRERDVACLDVWLGAAQASAFREVHGFVTHLQQDDAAVRAALSLPWSNGQTEGQITRLKLLKRQMYGRAKLDLLRARMLHRA